MKTRLALAAGVLLALAACGASPGVTGAPTVVSLAPPPAASDGGVAPPQEPSAEPTATPTPEHAGATNATNATNATDASAAIDAVDGGAHAGLNLHALHTPVPDDSLAAQGSGTPPAWPRGPTVEMGRARTSPPVSGVERVIAALRPAFRRCYVSALDRDPNLSGTVGFEAKLGPKGEVVGVKTTGGKGLSPELLRCISAVVASASFEAPPGGSAVLTMPFTLSR